MTVSCIIIDDEPVARSGIENYVKRIDFLKLMGSYSNPDKIEPNILSTIDLIFLDIKLHKTSGLDFYKGLRPNAPFAVVISAYSEYALDGFDLNVADYLLKPVSFERFNEAACRVKDLLILKSGNQAFYDAQSDYFYIKTNNLIQKLKHDEILYIEGVSNYVLIYTDKQKFLSYLSLNTLTEKLPKPKFIRIHKSYMVAIEKVNSIKSNEIYIQGHCLPLGKTYKDGFMAMVDQRLIKK